MLLREFLALQEVEETQGDLDRRVNGLTYDSRQVREGMVFFAIPGETFDGHDFVAEAVNRGASAVVIVRGGAPQGATFVRVKNVRRIMGLWSAHFYGRPSAAVKLVGITGTNGKTTVSYLVESMLAAAGLTPGVIGTVNYRFGARQIPAHHTTPESLDLHSLLAEMIQAGVKSVVMEVSSHALAQERVRGLEFDVAVFTNLSRDHLDYHVDMDDYFAAKSKLFTDYLKNSTKTKKAAVVYGANPYGEKLINKIRADGIAVWSYGEGPQWDIHPLEIKSDVTGQRGMLQVKDQAIEFASPLIGAANLQNIMGAAGAGLALGLAADAVVGGIQRLKSVPGRVEKVDNPLGIAIVVDYAHTPDALEKVLGAVRPLTRGRVVTVFGCGGDRDRGKRPLMGEIAARLSDVVVVTSDNPRTENPLAIVSEVEAGVRKAGLKKLDFPEPAAPRNVADAQRPVGRGYYVEADRRAAIREGLRAARGDDLVLIAGKGHEDYQILGQQRIHFDDREVAREEASRIAGQSGT
ncbi:MAG: UDP-N-acetylmuramoyl-L-alanyl-D-glutamate--2,6-diaminopimelate ligase [Alphaproteobacteria bacterium]